MTRKSRGQYYTSGKLADLLSHLSLSMNKAVNALDPMAGSGNLLVALQKAGIPQSELFGIDNDKVALSLCSQRLPLANLINASAFSSKAASLYTSQDWDLVAANPPYVRSELLRRSSDKDSEPEEIRRQLIGVLRKLKVSDPYIHCASKYNGNSNLSVPSSILCASLVKPGGVLALILPNACFTREYARPFLELLTSQFDIRYLIEDVSRSWFKPAQVKTHLLIAIKEEPSKNFKHVFWKQACEDSSSLFGKVSINGKRNYDALLELAKPKAFTDTDTLSIITQQTDTLVNGSLISVIESISGINLSLLNTTSDDWGIGIGQGLRTGANDFFYLEKRYDDLYTNRVFDAAGLTPLSSEIIPDAFLPVLKNQSEIKDLLLSGETDTRLLRLEAPLDECSLSDELRFRIKEAVIFAENNPIQSKGQQKIIPNMTAVRTNGGLSSEATTKYWYMLPRLHERHRPDFAIPRILGSDYTPICLPEDRQVVVDANFVSIWLYRDIVTREACYALLSSSLVWMQLECICNVMGGGALKIEAQDFRKLLLPEPSPELIEGLSQLGKELIHVQRAQKRESLIRKIDELLEKYLFVDASPKHPSKRLYRCANELCELRNK